MRTFLLVVVTLTCLPVVALAQDPPGDRVVHLGPVYVHPRGPHATYFLPRARVRFDPTDAEHHAVDRIVDSVRHDPF
jgi:hypothetical protein